MRLTAVLALIATPAFSHGYDAAVPDLNSIVCTFRAGTTPDLRAFTVEILRHPNEPLAYSWIEEGLPVVPVLAIFRMPDTPGALTSISTPDLGGQFNMITYDQTGAARHSRHRIDPNGGIASTAQAGTCAETKGA
ncbi:MAG: hypothetical protein ACRC14_12895 [Paracoccaceae bacterium]